MHFFCWGVLGLAFYFCVSEIKKRSGVWFRVNVNYQYLDLSSIVLRLVG
jgi:hypothetical protein